MFFSSLFVFFAAKWELGYLRAPREMLKTTTTSLTQGPRWTIFPLWLRLLGCQPSLGVCPTAFLGWMAVWAEAGWRLAVPKWAVLTYQNGNCMGFQFCHFFLHVLNFLSSFETSKCQNISFGFLSPLVSKSLWRCTDLLPCITQIRQIRCTLHCRETDSIAPGSQLLLGGLFPHQPGNCLLFSPLLKAGALQSSSLPGSGSTALPGAARPVPGLTSAACTWKWWGKSTAWTSHSASPPGGWGEEPGRSSSGGSGLNWSIPTAGWAQKPPARRQGQPTHFFQRKFLHSSALSPS